MITDSLTLSAIGVVILVLAIIGFALFQEKCPCKGKNCKEGKS